MKIKVVLPLRSPTNYRQEQNISLLSIIVFEASYKRILFVYTILIQENKQLTFSLNHLRNHYLSIYEENNIDGDLKSETSDSTRGSLRIQRTSD